MIPFYFIMNIGTLYNKLSFGYDNKQRGSVEGISDSNLIGAGA